MKNTWDNIKYNWKNFWFRFIETGETHFGDCVHGHYRFRWGRLVNVIILFLIVLNFIVVFRIWMG